MQQVFKSGLGEARIFIQFSQRKVRGRFLKQKFGSTETEKHNGVHPHLFISKIPPPHRPATHFRCEHRSFVR
jgi:hypothetical protein